MCCCTDIACYAVQALLCSVVGCCRQLPPFQTGSASVQGWCLYAVRCNVCIAAAAALLCRQGIQLSIAIKSTDDCLLSWMHIVEVIRKSSQNAVLVKSFRVTAVREKQCSSAQLDFQCFPLIQISDINVVDHDLEQTGLLSRLGQDCKRSSFPNSIPGTYSQVFFSPGCDGPSNRKLHCNAYPAGVAGIGWLCCRTANRNWLQGKDNHQ